MFEVLSVVVSESASNNLSFHGISHIPQDLAGSIRPGSMERIPGERDSWSAMLLLVTLRLCIQQNANEGRGLASPPPRHR